MSSGPILSLIPKGYWRKYGVQWRCTSIQDPCPMESRNSNGRYSREFYPGTKPSNFLIDASVSSSFSFLLSLPPPLFIFIGFTQCSGFSNAHVLSCGVEGVCPEPVTQGSDNHRLASLSCVVPMAHGKILFFLPTL